MNQLGNQLIRPESGEKKMMMMMMAPIPTYYWKRGNSENSDSDGLSR